MTRRTSRPIALIAATALLLGCVATVAVFELTGSLGTTRVVHTTNVVTTSGNSAISTGSSSLSAHALYTKAAAGVVDITASGISSSSNTGPFGAPQDSQTSASGSGFVADTKGHIVTAAHVVDGASTIKVKFQDGTTRTATVLGRDNATDVAVLKIDPAGLALHPLALGSSAQLQIGDAVAAIGDPFGYERSFSTGIVSGLDRTIQAPNGFTVAHAVQTDTALNPGNSGGPVLSTDGKVIGIVDQIATDGSSGQSSGVGFAVPIDLVKSELSALEAGSTVRHPYIGVSTSDASDGNGALVETVVTGGPAADAGVKAGDVITAIAGTKVAGSSGLVAAITEHRPGDKIVVTVRRNAETVNLTVTLGTQPSTRT